MAKGELDEGAGDRVVRVLAEVFSGTQLTPVLASAWLPDLLGEGTTKWKRVAAALSAGRESSGSQIGVLLFIETAMAPSRWVERSDLYEQTRRALNEVLAFAGAELRADGKLYERAVARTHDEALDRSRRL